MPAYSYICRRHIAPLEIQLQRKGEHRDDEVACPDCGEPMRRVLSAPMVVVPPQHRATKG